MEELIVPTQSAVNTRLSTSRIQPQNCSKPTGLLGTKTTKGREIVRLREETKINDYYDFGRLLGVGGFGTVSRILHAKTFQPFAGKVIRKSSLQTSDDIDEIFRRVMVTMLNHHHPNLVGLLHVYEDDGNYYTVMNLCCGGTLMKLYLSQQVLITVSENIMEQIGFALQFLHSLRLLHRDVKPDNIMIANVEPVNESQHLQVRVVDFDMCRFVDERGYVRSTHLEGTIGYLAPEVIERCQYSFASEFFSLGCVMFFMLKRKEPSDDMIVNAGQTRILVEVDHWLDNIMQLCAEAKTLAASASSSSSQLQPAKKVIPPVAMDPLRGRETPMPSRTDRRTNTLSKQKDFQEEAAKPAVLDEFLFEGAPVRLWKLMAWCLEHNPARRPQSARAFLDSPDRKSVV